jgi:predicted DNA-binding antitoxin AbrB/MazE fold protein
MTTTTLAVFENGVLRPLAPLPFAEGETVQVTVSRPEKPSQPVTPDEAERRMRTAKTLQEVFDAFESTPEQDDGYDLLQALDENRKGERPLFPPEMKGISW